MNVSQIKTSPAPHRHRPEQAWVAVTSSLLLHFGVIAAAISAPRTPPRSAAVRSGEGAIELQASPAATPVTPPQPIELESLDHAPPHDTPPPPELTARELEPMRRAEQQRSEVSRRSERRVPPAATAAATEPPPGSRPHDVDSSARRASAPQQSLPEVHDSARRPTATRPARTKPRAPTPVTSVVMPAAADTGAARETPTPLASNRPPRYPAEAMSARVEGTTLLRATVSDEGHVTQIEVNRSSGSSVLDQAAMSAVAMWRFEPQRSTFGGGSQTVLVPIEFKLER